MRNFKMKITVLALCISASACVGDKTEEQYRQDKVNEQNAKIQAKEGTYTGNLIGTRDFLSMGNMSIEFHPSTIVQNSSDNTGSERAANILGTLTYSGLANATVGFQKGYYDDSTGLFQAQFSIADSSSVANTFTIRGTISGSTFSGNITSDTNPNSQAFMDQNYGGKFTLVKGAPAAVAENLITGRVAALNSEAQSFSGTYLDENGQPQIVHLSITEKANHIQAFANLFLPQRKVNVYLDFGQGNFQIADGPQIQGGTFQIPLDPVTLDEVNNTFLDFADQVTSGTGAKSAFNLKCTRTATAGITESLSCTVINPKGAFVFTAKPIRK